MKDCTGCRWFVKEGEVDIDTGGFAHGRCCRPEGPLDPRTTAQKVISKAWVLSGHGFVVHAASGLVSQGMACRAFEARAVSQVTEKTGVQRNLWG